MVESAAQKRQKQQEGSLITSAVRRKRRDSPPLTENLPAKAEDGFPLSSIYPQAKKSRHGTPARMAAKAPATEAKRTPERAVPQATPPQPDDSTSATPPADESSPPASPPSTSANHRDQTPPRTRRVTPTPQANSSPQSSHIDEDDTENIQAPDQLTSSDSHHAPNHSAPAASHRSRSRERSPAKSRERTPSVTVGGVVLEEGSGGVPGKAGAPGKSPAQEQDAHAAPLASDADTDSVVPDRALCTLMSREDSDSMDEDDPHTHHQNLDGTAFDDEDMDGEEEAFDPYAFIKGLPPLALCTPPWRRSLLPRQTRQCKRKTLVLDLDETLVHSSLQEETDTGADFSFPVAFNGREHMVQVRKRPHLHQFLEKCAELFEVVVFTASQKIYAEQLLNVLDPQRRLIRHRIFRDSCVFVDGNYLKDLSSLGRELAHTLIIDNSPQAFGFQLRNGIPIESWYDDAQDTELTRLIPFLERCASADDVRPLIVNEFKTEQLVANAPGKYFQQYPSPALYAQPQQAVQQQS
ncbi:hypothetical protein WJX73_000916 [Symbiochloris irregularis]|uniref:FCP1 homology domain-containing protein n=1 Tax=Symbiochloris irregularis TaxID=706552 RepID=A0AAW1PS61_9CHLO